MRGVDKAIEELAELGVKCEFNGQMIQQICKHRLRCWNPPSQGMWMLSLLPRQTLRQCPGRIWPVSFSPVHRQYGFRPVREWRLDRPEMPEPTEHDPMAELQN